MLHLLSHFQYKAHIPLFESGIFDGEVELIGWNIREAKVNINFNKMKKVNQSFTTNIKKTRPWRLEQVSFF